VPLILLLLGVVVLLILLMPVSIVQRYRMGTRRRPARGWVASLNVAAFTLSAALVLISGAVTSTWAPGAFAYTAAGLGAGCILGVVGLIVSRWDVRSNRLHFTPNRLLVLTLTLMVTGRLAYGVWRAWAAWRVDPDPSSWLVASGVGGSMAAGATILGYYLAYWIGVRRRIVRHRRRMA
jgi:uncharacterized membrane protein HdeD (DUF308 family)